jgi:transposase
MKPISLDLRQRVLDAVDEKKMTRLEIAQVFKVCTAFVRRLVQRRREGHPIAPKPHAGGPKPILQEPQLQKLREAVTQKKDATLAELKKSLADQGIVVGRTTISEGLKTLGMTRKKRHCRPASGRVRKSAVSDSNIARRSTSIPSD